METETLFHYTTAAGLLGILETKRIWATDLRFLNDAQELTYGRQAVIDAIEARKLREIDPGKYAYKGEAGLQEAGARAELFDLVLDHNRTSVGFCDYGVYVTCFCQNGDLLSQWRGYGGDHGYSVEFPKGELERALAAMHGYPPASGLFRVRYGPANAKAKGMLAAGHVAKTSNGGHAGIKPHHVALAVNSLLAQIKHPGFEAEEEWRLVIGLTISGEAGNPPRQRTMYRATPRSIVPYLEIPFDPGAIVRINVGPGSNAEVRTGGVERLLKTLGLSAEVSYSKVPFRI
jgi:hypothetical protein